MGVCAFHVQDVPHPRVSDLRRTRAGDDEHVQVIHTNSGARQQCRGLQSQKRLAAHAEEQPVLTVLPAHCKSLTHTRTHRHRGNV